MTDTLLLISSIVFLATLVLVGLLRSSRQSRRGRPLDCGAVSTQWLAELKRDEPWTRS